MRWSRTQYGLYGGAGWTLRDRTRIPTRWHDASASLTTVQRTSASAPGVIERLFRCLGILSDSPTVYCTQLEPVVFFLLRYPVRPTPQFQLAGEVTLKSPW